jgi:hypothetical protein
MGPSKKIQGTFGCEPQTPTVSSSAKRRVKREKRFYGAIFRVSGWRSHFTLLKPYQSQAHSGKIPAKIINVSFSLVRQADTAQEVLETWV